MDVRPHPHIGLATVTWLFEGEILHRDSLGSVQSIKPGAVNWMTAGRGIVHSERTPDELRNQSNLLHGLQIWLGLPEEHEEAEPEFHHHSAGSLPSVNLEGVNLDLIAGSASSCSSAQPGPKAVVGKSPEIANSCPEPTPLICKCTRFDYAASVVMKESRIILRQLTHFIRTRLLFLYSHNKYDVKTIHSD